MNVICGLPRSGSTLLCNVLNQNPQFWASSTSILPGLCATLVHAWSTSPELKGELNIEREETEAKLKDILRTVCQKWHGDKEGRIVFDKARAWSYNVLLLRSFCPDSKVVITVRDLREVFASVEKQHRKTGFFDEAEGLLAKTILGRADALFSPEGLLGGPLAGIKDVIDRKLCVHWIKYEDLASSPSHAMGELYKYLDLPAYEGHDFEDVQGTAQDPDWLYLHKYPHQGTGKIEKPKSQWQEFMSDEIAELITEKFQWFQERFGYDGRRSRRQP